MTTFDQLAAKAGKRVDGYKKRAVKSATGSVKRFGKRTKQLSRKKK